MERMMQRPAHSRVEGEGMALSRSFSGLSSSMALTRFPVRGVCDDAFALFNHVGAVGGKFSPALLQAARPFELRFFDGLKLAQPKSHVPVRLGQVAGAALHHQNSHTVRSPNADAGPDAIA